MESDRYCIILRYDPEDLELHERVVACLSHLDPTAPERLKKTERGGRMIVKRNTDLATAERLKHRLRKTGALCSVQKLPLVERSYLLTEFAPLSATNR